MESGEEIQPSLHINIPDNDHTINITVFSPN